MTVRPDPLSGGLPNPDAVLTRLEAAVRETPVGAFVRVEFPVEGVLSPLSWLAGVNLLPLTYWRNREGTFEMAGAGAADVAQLGMDEPAGGFVTRLRERLAGAPASVRYYGGMCFSSMSVAGPWTCLGAGQFIVPAIEIARSEERTTLACNLRRADEDPSALIGEVAAQYGEVVGALAGAAPNPHPATQSRHCRPDRAAWCANVGRALGEIARGAIEKVVLAREVELTLAAPVAPVSLLARIDDGTPGTYAFCFQSAADQGFIGLSPEQLCQCARGRISGESLAGTRPRGRTPEEDAAMGRALVESDKERREQRFVTDWVAAVLGRNCIGVTGQVQPCLVKLPRVQHLGCRFEGILAPEATDGEVLGALHPTPAVGGVPQDAALAIIRQLEPFSRGWYAGPVGWIGREALEFAVGIRSGLVSGCTLRLYAGAGIVAGADPASEWDETEAKLATFLERMG